MHVEIPKVSTTKFYDSFLTTRLMFYEKLCFLIIIYCNNCKNHENLKL